MLLIIIMRKKLLTLFICMFCTTLGATANDGSYYASGNLLFPLQENDISVSSEVLTISIGDDGYATIDVLYTFLNNGPAKTIDMAFESPLPYNAGDGFSPIGKHPFIRNFAATLNGKTMSVRSAVVVGDEADVNSYKTYNGKQWHVLSEDFDYGDHFITNGEDTVEVNAYAYVFKAHFTNGRNIVHHTYKYVISVGLSANFEIPYILQPCTRWANHQVDDFTLRIATPATAKHFYLEDDVLRQTPFTVVSGMGKVRPGTMESNNDEEKPAHYQEISLRDGMVECHIQNFKPETSLNILSTDYLMHQLDVDASRELGMYYNRGWMYMPMGSFDFNYAFGRDPENDEEAETFYRRILRNLPYADRGYIFKDPQLHRCFEKQWWYMPDPNWKMSTKGFTKTDWHFINELSKGL